MNTTTEYEQIDLRKVLAEIDNLRAATLKMQSETQMQIEEREKLRSEMRKMQKEAHKIDAEILKINAETKWHPFYKVALFWGSAFAAAAAVIKFSNVFLK